MNDNEITDGYRQSHYLKSLYMYVVFFSFISFNATIIYYVANDHKFLLNRTGCKCTSDGNSSRSLSPASLPSGSPSHILSIPLYTVHRDLTLLGH